MFNYIVYFLICFLQPIMLPLPEPVTIMGGSSMFGPFLGAAIGFTGTFLGILVMFFASRSAGKNIVKKLIDEKKLEKFNSYIQKNEMLIILMLFILPILPDEVICVGAGLAGVTAYKFIGVAAIAKLITSISLSYSVEIIKLNSLSVILMAAAAGCFVLIKYIEKKKRPIA